MDRTFYIHIRGLVQGVGFRPFVYRIATRLQLTGWVDNRNDGVHIKINASEESASHFVNCIRNEVPPASNIISVEMSETTHELFNSFEIVKSKNTSGEITDVSPDIAVCSDCLADMKTQTHRIGYPFINCTNCGPRFTIIRDLPYDRDKTTMDVFPMCPVCNSEYKNVADRRFHAQPVACNHCGPVYTLHTGETEIHDIHEIVAETCKLIDSGKIVAIKGVGGFFIACDATNTVAVKNMREKKNREGKPFALMLRDIATAEKYARINEQEKTLLESWRRPIVLLQQKNKICDGLNDGLNSIGIMLPYMPFHHMMFEKLKTDAIVLTSGNFAEEPIVIDNHKAVKELTNIANAVLTYNRDIYNRADDSVTAVFNDKPRIFRRSRGFVPTPLNFDFNIDGILATGAELVNTFSIGKNKQAILSQHIGDLKNLETLDFFEESVERFKKLFRIKPELIVCDKHPDYLSTKYAKASGLPVFQVQHHYAHALACMADNNYFEPVIAVCLDGTGYGDDGNIWGGEFLICDKKDFRRFSHFDYIPLPGGDKVSKESWRSAVSYLYRTYGEYFTSIDIPFIQSLNKLKTEQLLFAIDNKINSPLSSGAGRLFDAVSAILNVCTHSTYQAEAPMRLEGLADVSISGAYDFELKNTLNFTPAIKEIVADIQNKEKLPVVATKFHRTIVNAVVHTVIKASAETGIKTVALSGGSFMNRFLSEQIEKELEKSGFNVLSHSHVPANDGGISLGQLIAGAAFLNNI